MTDSDREDDKLLKTALRQYQFELIQIARQRNSIIFLPTGAGKTFIALHVLRSRLGDLKLKIGEGGKIAVFLGTTKQLVKQLTSVIEENTTLRVKVFLGEMGVDNWTVSTWFAELHDIQVLCMTPAIFHLLIQRKIVLLNAVTLLVLDECHHAILNHPYNMIMREFDLYSEEEWPLVLGLTATVLNGNPEQEGMKEVEMLKRNLKCTFARTDKVEDALEYGTSPEEIYIEYKEDEMIHLTNVIRQLLESSFLRLHNLNVYGILEQRAENIVPRDCVLLHNKNLVVKEIRNMFRQLRRVLDEFGLHAASLGALYYMIRLEKLKYVCQNPVALTVIKYGITVLNLTRRRIFQLVGNEGTIDIRKYSSPKVNALIDFVEQIEDKNKLTCLIIVEERITAAVLSSLFNELSVKENNPYFKTSFITGGMFNSVTEKKEHIEEQKRMKDILASFRKLDFHFLFATDVIEEGIDLPDCNVVIKLDEPKDYRSYVQCKGRARSKTSQFVIFYKAGYFPQLRSKTQKYDHIQQKLLQTVHFSEEMEDSWTTEDHEEEEEEEEMFFIDGPKSLHISGTRAIQFLIRYCSLLPQDSYSCLAPLCWYDKEAKIAYLQMPSSCPLQKVIKGDPKHNRKLAKKNVFLKAVKELYAIGEILGDLTFRSYKCNEEDYAELFPCFRQENDPKDTPQPGTAHRKRTYEVKYADNLCHCFPQPGAITYLHLIKITPTVPRPEGSREGTFYDLLRDEEEFAILTSKRLSRICDFPLFLNVGDFNCSLVVNASKKILSSREIEKLKRFHFFIFHSLLNVTDRLQVIDNRNEENSYLVAPVKFFREVGYFINWDVVDQFVYNIETIDLGDMISENPAIQDYLYSVVYPKYRKSPCSNKYYIVTSLDHSRTPLSQFPSEDFQNYCIYYEKKYQMKILNTSQPLLEVKLIPTKINYLRSKKLPRPFKRKKKYEEENESFKEDLIPELCCISLVPASLWLKATMLPSALYRISVISCVDDMRKAIALETKLGILELSDDMEWNSLQVEKEVFGETIAATFSSGNNNGIRKAIPQENDSDLQQPIDLFRRLTECASCDLKHYVKYYKLMGNEDEDAQNHSKREVNEVQIEQIEVPDLPVTFTNNNSKGPELCDFVKVFTCKSARDIVDLERLEFFGDSFLKFAAAFYLFKKFKANEGILVAIKDKIIGNRNLYYCAVNKGLEGPLIVNEFEPKSDWIAPLFCLPEEIRSRMNEETNSFEIDYLFEISIREKLNGELIPQTIKSIQDFAELNEKRSVYSIDQSFFGRKVLSDKSVADCVEALIGLYVKDCGIFGGFTILNWLGILPSSDGSYEEVMLKKHVFDCEGNESSAALSEIAYEELEKIIGYKFKNKELLSQALTHPSFVGAPVSYQRLEFLGDSVLDFLVTVYIHHFCTKLSPGQMTDIRSALVNNSTFACLSVKYNIHKYLLHHSPQLLSVICQFANFQKSRNHKIDTAVLVLKEEEECRLADSVEVPKALGDIFESIAGAVFLDSGNNFKSVWNMFYRMMKDIIDDFSRDPPKSPIRILYETCKPPPEFSCSILDDGIVLTSCKLIINEKEQLFHGRGRNTERSKLSAATLALRFLEKNKGDIC